VSFNIAVLICHVVFLLLDIGLSIYCCVELTVFCVGAGPRWLEQENPADGTPSAAQSAAAVAIQRTYRAKTADADADADADPIVRSDADPTAQV
jgi:hypothetical protein